MAVALDAILLPDGGWFVLYLGRCKMTEPAATGRFSRSGRGRELDGDRNLDVAGER